MQTKIKGIDHLARKRKQRSPGKESVSYLLPVELVKQIAHEAAERGMFPSHVVTERLLRSYQLETPAA